MSSTEDDSRDAMKTWSLHDASTGIFDGRTFHGDRDGLALQLRFFGPAVAAFEGVVDYQRQRLDMATGQIVAYVPPPPADTAEWVHTWDAESATWVAKATLAAAQRDACAAIDAAAGAARLRYITEEPGQQAVYLRKAEQSRVYRNAGYEGAVPAYVAAEAQAMGLTPQAAADRILAIADAWDEQLSPAIEGLRIGAKNTVTLAATVDAVTVARDAVLLQLAAI